MPTQPDNPMQVGPPGTARDREYQSYAGEDAVPQRPMRVVGRRDGRPIAYDVELLLTEILVELRKHTLLLRVLVDAEEDLDGEQLEEATEDDLTDSPD